MFIDASALVAILNGEPDAEELAAALEKSTDTVTSPVALVETVMSLGKQRGIDPHEAFTEVSALLRLAGVVVRAVDCQTGIFAIDAHARFGKGSGHRARLNLGDCFAYAAARQHGLRLLYKGDDFSHTDIG